MKTHITTAVLDVVFAALYTPYVQVEFMKKKQAAKCFDRREDLDEKFQIEVEILFCLHHDNTVEMVAIILS